MTYKVVPLRGEILLFNKSVLQQRNIESLWFSEAINQEQGPFDQARGFLNCQGLVVVIRTSPQECKQFELTYFNPKQVQNQALKALFKSSFFSISIRYLIYSIINIFYLYQVFLFLSNIYMQLLLNLSLNIKKKL